MKLDIKAKLASLKPEARKFTISFLVCVSIFGSGGLFGYGYSKVALQEKYAKMEEIVRTAHDYGFEKGELSAVMERLEYKPKTKNPGKAVRLSVATLKDH